jgi:hypothetical protein
VQGSQQPSTSVVSGTLEPVFRFHRDDFFFCVGSAATSAKEVLHPSESCARPDVPLTLVVSDKDATSSEVIGTATLSTKLLLAGLWHTHPERLASLKAEDRAQWIADNRASLLTLPLVRRGSDGRSGELRGEITLATTFSAGVYGAGGAPLDDARRVGGTVIAPTLVAARRILERSRQWADVEELHWFVGRQLLGCSSSSTSSDLLLKAPAKGIEDRAQQLLQAMTREYGAGPS